MSKILFKLNPYLQQRQREKVRWIFPIYLSMYATALRNQGNNIVWDGVDDGSFDRVITSEKQIDIPFLELPHADRILTSAKNYKWQGNGNFKYLPGCYLLSAKGCSWSKCSFCVEKGQPYEVRPVEDVISEIEEIKSQGYKEVFDDSATIPKGEWLDLLCKILHATGLGRAMRYGCNVRLADYPFDSMRRAGFRMLLFGVESANQLTLDRINKGVKVEDIKYIRIAAEAGLEPHIAVQFGFPWESDADAVNTLRMVHSLLRKGYAKTTQASFYTPPDGENKREHRKFVGRIYEVAYSPQFWFNQLKDIKDINDIKYLWRKIKAGLWQ